MTVDARVTKQLGIPRRRAFGLVLKGSGADVNWGSEQYVLIFDVALRAQTSLGVQNKYECC